MVSNLTCEGPSNALEVTGEFMNEQQSTETWMKTGNSAALQMLYFVRLILASHFDELELASDMSSRLTKMYLDGSEVLVPFRFFLKGLAAFSMAKRTGKHKLHRRGRKVVKVFETWVGQGMVNGHHMLLFLRAADMSGSSAKPEDVRKAFDEAIKAAARLGFLHNQALANQRAGLYFLEQNDESWATYLSRARDLYCDWGAFALVHYLETKYEGLIGTSSVSSEGSSSCLQGRARLGDLSRAKAKEKSLGIFFRRRRTIRL
jgi:hypothetical protein